MCHALKRKTQPLSADQSLFIKDQCIIQSPAFRKSVLLQIVQLRGEPKRTGLRNYIIKSLACDIIFDFLGADRRSRIINYISDRQLLRGSRGKQTSAVVFFQKERRCDGTLLPLSVDLFKTAILDRLGKGEGASVKDRNLTTGKFELNGLKSCLLYTSRCV